MVLKRVSGLVVHSQQLHVLGCAAEFLTCGREERLAKSVVAHLLTGDVIKNEPEKDCIYLTGNVKEKYRTLKERISNEDLTAI